MAAGPVSENTPYPKITLYLTELSNRSQKKLRLVRRPEKNLQGNTTVGKNKQKIWVGTLARGQINTIPSYEALQIKAKQNKIQILTKIKRHIKENWCRRGIPHHFTNHRQTTLCLCGVFTVGTCALNVGTRHLILYRFDQ